MVRPLFDTNILIDYLSGVPQAADGLGRYDEKAISIVTWMEIMAGAAPTVQAGTQAFLDSFDIIPLDNPVAERAIAYRKASKARLPDAIIWASAQGNGSLLVTQKQRISRWTIRGVRMPYVVWGR